MAGEGYSSRGVDIPACAVDAPHKRNRVYWIAVANGCGIGQPRFREPKYTGFEGTPRHLTQRHTQDRLKFRSKGTYWSDAKWVQCRDGKARRAKPDICLLVDGVANRINLWRIVGNAIVPQVAAEVIKAFIETEGEDHG